MNSGFFNLFCALFLLCSLSFAPVASAEDDSEIPQLSEPEQLVAELIGKLRQTQDLCTVIEYVNWSDAFSRLDPGKISRFQISGAYNLKKFHHEYLTGSPELRLRSADPAKTGSLSPHLPGQMEAIGKENFPGRKRSQFAPAFATQLYEIRTSSVEGNRAWVEVEIHQASSVEKKIVPLMLENGKWYLTCPVFTDDPLSLCPK